MKHYPLAEQKLVYRILHRHLTEAPELMDSEFLHDLQTQLQKQALAEGVDVADHGDVQDRKSTRLNSSHRCISYAVFCLKKKKKAETDNAARATCRPHQH